MELSGVYPPIAVPFTETGEIDNDGFTLNLNKWMDQGLSGVIFPGSNSEFPFLELDEKIQLWKICAAVVKGAGRKLIAGTGCESTTETIALTNIATDLGADAALIIPPYFYKPDMKHNVLVEHYTRVADESKIPVLIYNVPAFSGIDFLPETIIALAGHPNIIGMKDSSSNVLKATMVLAEYPEFQVFCGTGGSLLPFLSLGAVGGIMALANFAGEPLLELFNSFHSNEMAVARKLQHRLVNINSAVTARFGISGLKYAMNRCGFTGGYPRRPLLPVDNNTAEVIDTLLIKAGLLKE